MAQVTVPSHLFKSLHLSNPQSYNIYLVGSRLWGTNTDASDWDLLIVGDVSSTQLTSLHKAQYDVKVLDRHEFMQHINDGSIIEILCALMRKEDMLQYAFDLSYPAIDPATIKTWMETRRIKDLDKAEKFWLKGNRQAAWKILRHILHAKVLYDYLVIALREKRMPLTIDDIQTIVRPASLLCEKSWMQLDWSDVRAATIDALAQL